MKINDLERVAVIGLGLLGGSAGLAIKRVFGRVRCVGYSHRAITRRKAKETGTMDAVCSSVSEAVGESQLVILASPIGTFESLMGEMVDHLSNNCIVTDVGSTKMLPVRWARTILGDKVEYLGSHPMAGSEQRGVEFARADLFENATCIITPTGRTKTTTVSFMRDFWRALGMRVRVMSPAEHDRVLARISHLPHVLASALVSCSEAQQMLLCGKGFLDTTRIASGPPGVWRDILMANAPHTAGAIGRLIKELTRIQKALEVGDEKAIMKILSEAQAKRNDLVEKKLRRKELPA